MRAIGLGLLVGAALGSAVPLAAQTPAERALVDAASAGWSVGAEDAPVSIVEFSDLSCPFCASFHVGTRKALRDEFVEGGQVRWVTLSYVSGQYRHSELPARGAECAGRQGHYEAFSAWMLAARDRWVEGPAERVEAVVGEAARELELDAEAFAACLLDESVRERLAVVRQMAVESGVRGTPTWFVDGFPVMGDLPGAYARSFIVDRLEGGER